MNLTIIITPSKLYRSSISVNICSFLILQNFEEYYKFNNFLIKIYILLRRNIIIYISFRNSLKREIFRHENCFAL